MSAEVLLFSEPHLFSGVPVSRLTLIIRHDFAAVCSEEEFDGHLAGWEIRVTFTLYICSLSFLATSIQFFKSSPRHSCSFRREVRSPSSLL